MDRISLPHLLFELLYDAQKLYGPRDPSFMVDIETAPGSPYMFQPDVTKRRYLIRVPPQAETSLGTACFTIGHEAIHVLSCAGQPFTTFLEEGLGQCFGFNSAARRNYFEFSPRISSPYFTAERLVSLLLRRDPTIVKRVRTIKPCLSKVTAELLLAECPTLDPRIAIQLTTRFPGEDNNAPKPR